MAIKFITNRASELLSCFKKAIDDKRIETWSYDNEGDFTHTPVQWRHKAWLKPIIRNSELVFGIIKPLQSDVTWEIYGIYHGRMMESMIVHCQDLFTNGIATARPTSDDTLS
jgi:hypothetical protein